MCLELSQLFKTVQNLKMGHTLANYVTQKRTLVILSHSVSDKVLKNQNWATLVLAGHGVKKYGILCKVEQSL